MNRAAILGLLALAIPGTLVAQQEGWIKVTTKGQFLSLSMPSTYIVADPDDPSSKESIVKMKETNPKMAETFERSMNRKFEFNAADSATGGVSNFNVMVTPAQGLKPSMYGQLGKEILKQAPFNGKGKHRNVKYPSGEYLNYSSDVTINGLDGTPLEMTIQGFMTVKKDQLYVVTFTALTKEAGKDWVKMVEDVMKSVQILK